MEKPVLLKIENLTKVYRMGKVEVHALRGVNMEVYDGEMLSIVGPSGSGKTTLLNIIATLDKPTSGRVLFRGEGLTKLKGRRLLEFRRRQLGFIFQEFNLIPVLSAVENVEMPMVIAGVPRRERRSRALELLELVGLEDRADHRPSELSGGEQQRVAIARALANNPSLIIADEPTGELDTGNTKAVIEILREALRSRGATAILVTHDPSVAGSCDRVLRLRDGVIAGEGVDVE